MLRDVKPVGYHAWASSSLLALFVLGQQGQPATLQVADARNRAGAGCGDWYRPVDSAHPGRRDQLRAATRAGRRRRRRLLTISELDPATRQTRPLVRAPAGATEADTAWTPDGLLLVSVQGQAVRLASRRGRR